MEKTVFDLYNEMAAHKDERRKKEWTELTDTMLVFVSYKIFLYLWTHASVGGLVCRVSLRVPNVPAAKASGGLRSTNR